MMFKARSIEDSLLLFNGQGLRGKGDYISLFMKDEKLVFQYDSGSGMSGLIITRFKKIKKNPDF